MTTYSERYDVAIIGAGLSGLVCGCILAKRGLKSLIIEKNAIPGGYCTSFSRKGFNFDSCVYSLSSFRKNASLNKLFRELSINDAIKFNRFEIPDIVMTPAYKVRFFNNLEKTIKEVQSCFPKNKIAIRNFFKLTTTSNSFNLVKYKNISFKKMLDYFFDNEELKVILSIMLLGYTGLPPSQLSSLVACLIYKEFIFDGGYYPERGMQSFPDVLAQKFFTLGGRIFFSTKAEEIHIKNGEAKGVIIKNGILAEAKFIVSACDAHQTFYELIKREFLSDGFIKKIKLMKPSLSAFLIYLGLNSRISNDDLRSHIWIIKNNYNDIEKIYSNMLKHKFDYLAMSSSSLRKSKIFRPKVDTIFCFVNSPFFTKSSWDCECKETLAKQLLNMSKLIIPNIDKLIDLKITASPRTLYNWSLNYKGACYGWADTIKQFCDPNFSEKTVIKNLYLTGHWSNKSSGVASVVNSGMKTAQKIISDWKS
ncbi:MAG: NAD(P)/FAD-dependent oxidoreductase [Candidatus Omnitrophota bacterium]